ncbi:MAG: GntR family transcriptional regulator [Novosphingobium sp.]|nr:GntR family transcriptional regulator [Novosphingobium sp.]MCP5404204.1 GntR family transcriptional regulator [Novosphingobium sp.]
MTTNAKRRSRSGQRLVHATAERLREMIYATEPESRIGSLTSLAETLGVGIVTVQQAARILEHEGLLEVRRGPGGGYYGKRPDEADLERSLAAYMRTEPSSWEEALEMTSLLFNELAAAAARCEDEDLYEELEEFLPQIDACADDAGMGDVEAEFQDLLFRMVNRPLFELLTRVTLRFAESRPYETGNRGLVKLDKWKAGRHRIIRAILGRDEELARFEANRSNRLPLLARVRELAK